MIHRAAVDTRRADKTSVRYLKVTDCDFKPFFYFFYFKRQILIGIVAVKLKKENSFPQVKSTIIGQMNRPVLTDTETYYIQTDKHPPLGAKRAFLLRLGEEVIPSPVPGTLPGTAAVSQPQLELRVPGQRVAVGTGGIDLLHVFTR